MEITFAPRDILQIDDARIVRETETLQLSSLIKTLWTNS
mgnify:CR=1 FL=1